ncbi:MAG TPA: hypothetical protein PK340_02270 [Bacilli bacterium]|nr:hypothetical protein [Bacilli bacterium]
MAMGSLVAPTRTRGTYLLASYDFRSETLPSGVITDALQYEEDGHHRLLLNRIGAQVDLTGFQSYHQLIVETSLSGLTIEAGETLLEDVPVFTLQSHYDQALRNSIFVYHVTFNETMTSMFPIARTNRVVLTMSNFASMNDAPGFAYSLLLSHIRIYEFVA